MTARPRRFARAGSRSINARGPPSRPVRDRRGPAPCRVGYHLRFAQWCAFLDRMAAPDAPAMLNRPALLRWNATSPTSANSPAGVPTVASRTVAALDDAALTAARETFGDELVIKPLVSAAADDTYRLGPDDPIPARVRGANCSSSPSCRRSRRANIRCAVRRRFSHCIVKRPGPVTSASTPPRRHEEAAAPRPRDRPCNRRARRRPRAGGLCARRHGRGRRGRAAVRNSNWSSPRCGSSTPRTRAPPSPPPLRQRSASAFANNHCPAPTQVGRRNALQALGIDPRDQGVKGRPHAVEAASSAVQ